MYGPGECNVVQVVSLPGSGGLVYGVSNLYCTSTGGVPPWAPGHLRAAQTRADPQGQGLSKRYGTYIYFKNRLTTVKYV